MPRTLDPILEAALDAQNFAKPIIRGWLGVDGAQELEVQILKYKLQRRNLTATIYAGEINLLDLAYTGIRIERGLEISGIEYVTLSCAFTINSASYKEGLFTIQANLIND